MPHRWRQRVCTLAVSIALVWPATAPGVDVPAFQGAEGFGAVASGGRGGEVCYVTSLADDGPGSLRDAVSRGNRTILFKTSGTIGLRSTLRIDASNITIAGQTAPGDGICLRGKELLISGDNVIVRFLRLRPGDELGQEHDAVTVWAADRVILDHCSMSWSTDSINDVVKESTNVTVQWCILSEPLNRSVHVKGAHGYGTGWGSGGAGGATYHHNLLAHCNSRSPRIGGEQQALVDVRNNVVYNMGGGWAYGGEHARINYVANYFKPGRDTAHPQSIFRISNPGTRIYAADNVVEGYEMALRDTRAAVRFDDGIDAAAVILGNPHPVPIVQMTPAERALSAVLESAGATLPRRDAVDERIVRDVREGTGSVINSQADVGGWPELRSAEPRVDGDSDGMPDAWEKEHGLNDGDANDGIRIRADGYTELEQYLHWLAARVPGSPD